MKHARPIPIWTLAIATREAAAAFGVDYMALVAATGRSSQDVTYARHSAWSALVDAGHGPTAIARAFNTDARHVRRTVKGAARGVTRSNAMRDRAQRVAVTGEHLRRVEAGLAATRANVRRLRARAGEVAA